jgi:PAS domain S-box-containing protein
VTDELLERLRASLAFTELVIAPTGDALSAFDAELRYLYWGPAMERISGVRAAEVMGRPALEVFPFLVDNGEHLLMRAGVAGAPGISREQRFEVPETGRSGYYDAYYSPLRESDRVIACVAVVRDITERKTIAQHVHETENRFKNMADASPVLLWMSGPDSLCTFFNQTWVDFTGRTLEEEWGIGWAEGVHFEDLQRCMDRYMSAFNQRQPFEMEYRLRRRDGEYRWILDRGIPRYLPDGTFAGYIGSCVDITERKELEVALRFAVKTRDDFLSIAAHELRTPLTPIQLGVQGLQRAVQRREAALPLLRKIDSLMDHVSRQARLVEDLLDVSRISTGPVPLELGDVDLSMLVREVARRATDEALGVGSSLEVTVDEPIHGHWDAARLEQILRNLLSNAIKYGAGKPIHVAVDANATHARLRVHDDGIGIPPEEQARIFERFERAVPARSFAGFGLGLWVTRKLVGAMGGTIEVDSGPGRGTTFLVELPRQPPAA